MFLHTYKQMCGTHHIFWSKHVWHPQTWEGVEKKERLRRAYRSFPVCSCSCNKWLVNQWLVWYFLFFNYLNDVGSPCQIKWIYECKCWSVLSDSCNQPEQEVTQSFLQWGSFQPRDWNPNLSPHHGVCGWRTGHGWEELPRSRSGHRRTLALDGWCCSSYPSRLFMGMGQSARMHGTGTVKRGVTSRDPRSGRSRGEQPHPSERGSQTRQEGPEESSAVEGQEGSGGGDALIQGGLQLCFCWSKPGRDTPRPRQEKPSRW